MAEKKKLTLKKRKALGKGLGALLEDNATILKKENPAPKGESGINEIQIDHIETNPYQPRTEFDRVALEELADSIRMQGIIQPITVRKLDEENYQLISGERRLQASKMIGSEKIVAYVRTANDQQMLEMALIENIQRQELNAIEIALSYQRLLTECDLRQEDLGSRVGKNRSTVNNYLRLLKLPPAIQVGLRDRKISMGHARALVNVSNVETQLVLYKKIVEEGLSVRRVEELVRNLSNPVENKEKKEKLSATYQYEINRLESTLSSRFSTKIKIKSSEENKGEIRIPFDSLDELNRLLDEINK